MATFSGKSGYSPEGGGAAAGVPGYSGFSTPPVSTLPIGLISYWALDEVSGNRTDSKDSNTLTDNGTVGSAAGVHNLGANFVAANSEFLSSTADLTQTGDYSISAWVNPVVANEAVTWGSAFISDIKSPSVNTPLTGSYALTIENTFGNLLWYDWKNDGTDTTGKHTYNTLFGSSPGWHHIVAVKSSGTLTLYSDGLVLTEAAANSTSNDWGDTKFRLGNMYIGAGFFYDGGLDEVGLWSRALTSGEVAELYNGGSGKFYPF